jgi:hypothetical protein
MPIVGISTIEWSAYVVYALTTRSPIFASTCEHQAIRFALCDALRDTSRFLAPDEVDFASEETKEMMAGTDDIVAWPCVRKGSLPAT